MGCSSCGGGSPKRVIHRGQGLTTMQGIDYVFISSDQRPRSGWRFVDPITKTEFGPKQSQLELIGAIHAHRKEKELPDIENLGQTILNYLATLPENKFLFTQVDSRRRFGDIANGLMHVTDIFGQKEYVEEQEAKRRARICITCPYNGTLKLTATERIIDNRIMQQVQGKHTGYDAGLFHCKLCKCLLKAKVWFKKEVILKGLTDEVRDKLPNGNIVGLDGKELVCWQLGTEKSHA